jgi:AcrR family transcriptional regulator
MTTRHDTRRGRSEGAARERLVQTAYRLFQRNALNTVGVDRIVAEAEVAKMTLYRHFASKDDLAVAVLAHHEEEWIAGWLEQVIAEAGPAPGDRVLALFDAFDEWFRRDDYNGCLFTRALLEADARPVRGAAAAGLASVRTVIRELAEAAGARDPDRLALQIQLLLLGSTVVAVSGQLAAARHARDAAGLLLAREGIPTRS